MYGLLTNYIFYSVIVRDKEMGGLIKMLNS